MRLLPRDDHFTGTKFLIVKDHRPTDGITGCGRPSLVRDREALRRAMAISAAYYGPLTKREPCSGVPTLHDWPAPLNFERLCASLEKTEWRTGGAPCRHASRFANNLSNAGFEILKEVVLNQVLVAFGGQMESPNDQPATGVTPSPLRFSLNRFGR